MSQIPTTGSQNRYPSKSATHASSNASSSQHYANAPMGGPQQSSQSFSGRMPSQHYNNSNNNPSTSMNFNAPPYAAPGSHSSSSAQSSHVPGTSSQQEQAQFNGPSSSGYYGHSNSRYGEHGASTGCSGNRPEGKLNHVLLITVINPAYPINCDVIHQICTPQGKVLRIVIFKKNGVQAMVEFDSLESAKRAKLALNGCDIYSGCCTLKVEFAKVRK